MKLFSVDDHIIEPADLWSKRVPAKFRESAPHVIEEDGREHWVYEDQRGFTMGFCAVVGRPREFWDQEPVRFADMRMACYDPLERAKDLVSESITASVSFPSLPRFGGALFPEFKDKELADACVRAWNDFLFEEWCAAAPDVFVPMIILQLWDPKAAAAEIERNVARGARAVAMPEQCLGHDLPSYYDPFWDPIWSACQNADIPVCMHIGSSGWKAYRPPGSPDILGIALSMVATITHSIGMAFGPVPRKFPRIKLVYAEGGIGWVPVSLERADSRFELHHLWSGTDDLLPSEVFKRNMWFCVMPDEQLGVEQRHQIGVDKILWEMDYPHSNCCWPDSESAARDLLKGVPQDEFDKITYANAEGLFKWRCLDSSEFNLGERQPLMTDLVKPGLGRRRDL
jgi:predicted TIM-barrel fold metal-dependent hydrolase